MKRMLVVAVLLAVMGGPVAASDLGFGGGLNIGTRGVQEAAFIVMWDAAEIAPWRLGPITVPACDLVGVGMTKDFEDAYVGGGLRRGHRLISGGYNTATRKLEGRLTLLGVSF